MGIGPLGPSPLRYGADWLLKQDVGWPIWLKGFGHAGMFPPDEKDMSFKCWGPCPRLRLRVLSNAFRLGEYGTGLHFGSF